MNPFYGWVIVGVGMVVTCVGFGAMFSLGVFLQPMSEAMGWSRTGISAAALLYLVTREAWHFYAVALVFGFGYGGVMPLYAIVVREYFGARIMGTIFGAAGFASTLGMALGPLVGGWMYDAFGSYAWLFIGSSGVGLGAVAIACTFRPPRQLPAALPSLSVAH